jgi:hypothetical protein
MLRKSMIEESTLWSMLQRASGGERSGTKHLKGMGSGDARRMIVADAVSSRY